MVIIPQIFPGCRGNNCGLSEHDGAVWSADGLDVDAVFNHRKTTGTIQHFPGANNFNHNSDMLEMDVIFWYPAALENVVNGDNASRIKAKIIGEQPTGLFTRGGWGIYKKKDIGSSWYVPECRRVTFPYFEWLKNLSHVRYGLWKKGLLKSDTHILGQMERTHCKKVKITKRVDHARPPMKWTLYIVAWKKHDNGYAWNHELLEKTDPDIPDMRTAAYVVALIKWDQLCGAGNIS